MLQFRAALAAAVALLAVCPTALAVDPPVLSLQRAFERVSAAHPDLAIHRYRAAAGSAQVDLAAQKPPVEASLALENVLGSGDSSSLRSAELTASIGSVIERGGKRSARQELAALQLDGLQTGHEARWLDLMAETARRYLDAVAADAQGRLWAEDAEQRRRSADAARRRMAAGGAPAYARLAAEAAGVEAEGRSQRALRMADLQRIRLAVLWGGDEAEFAVVDTLDALPDVEPLPQILVRLQDTPELRAFASAERVREARLQLARSERVTDVGWSVGVRRTQSNDDWGLLGSVSIPLGTAARAQPRIREAEAELAAIGIERDSLQRALEATLTEAWSQLDAAVAEARHIDDALLPVLDQAAEAAQQAYRAGAIGYRDWASMQDDITAARIRRLQAVVKARRALIELQRLTGSALEALPTNEAPANDAPANEASEDLP